MRVERIGNAVLYLGDCLEILPTLPKVDAVITDPPYGTGYVRGGGRVGEFNAKHEKPAWDVFSVEWMRFVNSDPVVSAFCAPSMLSKMCAAFARPHVARYKKTNVRPGGSEYEFIVSSSPWRGDRWEVVAYNEDCEYHPTQKPVPVMVWCIASAPIYGRSLVVVDPFMGSGTTGVACAQLGRDFIGIEIEPKYFDIACERIENAQRQSSMFTEPRTEDRSKSQLSIELK